MEGVDSNMEEVDSTTELPQNEENISEDHPEKETKFNTDNDTSQNEENPNPEGLSKNQLKKLRRTQKWEERKAEKRLKERQKKRDKRKLLVEAGNAPLAGSSMRKKLKKNRMKDSACQVKVVIDCSFDDLMNEKDINRMVSQIQYCYSSNRRAANPMQMYVTSVGGATHTRLNNCGEYDHWDVNFHKESFSDLFKKEDIVYLSSDSDNVLQELEPEKAYVIGGLVDHNRHKGLCHNMAVEKGYNHAQLPIGEFIKLKSRKVLTINHVYEILLYVTEGQTWEEAFYKAIPKRKIDNGDAGTADNDDPSQPDCETSSNKEDKADIAPTTSNTDSALCDTDSKYLSISETGNS